MIEWRAVPGYQGYEVTRLGDVRSWRTGAPKAIAPYVNKAGYAMVTLAPTRSKRYVHQLVALAFIGPPPDGQEIRHLDGNPRNNHVHNLCYGTPAENQGDRLRHGRDNRGEKSGTAKLTREDVMEIRRRYGPYSKNGRGRAHGGDTQRSLAAEYGVSWQRIGSIVRGETWSHLFDSSLDDVAARLDRLID